MQAQQNNHTHLGRIAAELTTIRSHMTDQRRLKILSFGCSIGDEIATILARFPDADVYGCEINPPILEAAQRTVGHLATVFLSTPENIAAHGPYDIIVASAVLCLHPAKGIEELFPYSQFETMLGWLDAALVEGGYLVLKSTSYMFQHTPYFKSYDTIRSPIIVSAGNVDTFRPDGTAILKMHIFMGRQVFRRCRGFDFKDDELLVDSVYQKMPGGAGGAIHWVPASPVPESFEEMHRFTRSDTDTARDLGSERMIVRTMRYRYGRDPETNRIGYAFQISWPSVVKPGETYVRPEFWLGAG